MKKLLILLITFAQVAAAGPTCEGIVATKPELETHFKDMEYYWPGAQSAFLANSKARQLPEWDLLKDSERVSLNFYTYDIYGENVHPISGSAYILNPELREKNLQHVNMFRVLCSALNKLPNYSGIIYRVAKLSPEEFREIAASKRYYDPAFMSSSKSLWLADHYSGDVLFIIHSLTGKDIEKFSHFESEGEVLIRPGTHYRVLKTTESTNRKYHYEVEMYELPKVEL